MFPVDIMADGWEFIDLYEKGDPIGYCGVILTEVDGENHACLHFSKYGLPYETPGACRSALKQRRFLWFNGRTLNIKVYIVGLSQLGISQFAAERIMALGANNA